MKAPRFKTWKATLWLLKSRPSKRELRNIIDWKKCGVGKGYGTLPSVVGRFVNGLRKHRPMILLQSYCYETIAIFPEPEKQDPYVHRLARVIRLFFSTPQWTFAQRNLEADATPDVQHQFHFRYDRRLWLFTGHKKGSGSRKRSWDFLCWVLKWTRNFYPPRRKTTLEIYFEILTYWCHTNFPTQTHFSTFAATKNSPVLFCFLPSLHLPGL